MWLMSDQEMAIHKMRLSAGRTVCRVFYLICSETNVLVFTFQVLIINLAVFKFKAPVNGNTDASGKSLQRYQIIRHEIKEVFQPVFFNGVFKRSYEANEIAFFF